MMNESTATTNSVYGSLDEVLKQYNALTQVLENAGYVISETRPDGIQCIFLKSNNNQSSPVI